MHINYLTIENILFIHQEVMEKYGEGEQAGVMFPEKLVSAVLRPQAEYFGQELFPTIWDKVGALIQSIAQEHVFRNGNKRTAFAVAQIFLLANGYILDMDEKEAEDMMVVFVTEEQYKGNNGAYEIGRYIESKVKSYL